MKFIEYPVGGYIAPHIDGVRTDEVQNPIHAPVPPSGLQLLDSMLSYTPRLPPGRHFATPDVPQASWVAPNH
jgi:hypothetical protein